MTIAIPASGSPPEGCWRVIGVFAPETATCPELKRYLHCRNCHVFVRAGRELLERDLSEQRRSEWTAVMSAEKIEEIPGTMSVTIFRIAAEWIALKTRLLAEVIKPERYHRIPHRKNPVLLGLVNVHGELRLCVSLRKLLGIEKSTGEEPGRRAYRRMIVLDNGGEQWVFPVDEIHGIHRIHPDAFQTVPATVARSRATYTAALFSWNGRNVALLDDDLLLCSLERSVQ